MILERNSDVKVFYAVVNKSVALISQILGQRFGEEHGNVSSTLGIESDNVLEKLIDPYSETNRKVGSILKKLGKSIVGQAL